MNHGEVKPAILITGRNPEARSVTCREVEASGVGSGAIAVQQVHQYLSGRDGRR